MRTHSDVWQKRFRLLFQLLALLLIGLAIAIPNVLLNASVAWVIVGIALWLPGAIYLFLVTIWHWKERYRGSHSDLWGALILIETSGCFKIVYLFRHIIPDARATGRYAHVAQPAEDSQR